MLLLSDATAATAVNKCEQQQGAIAEPGLDFWIGSLLVIVPSSYCRSAPESVSCFGGVLLATDYIMYRTVCTENMIVLFAILNS